MENYPGPERLSPEETRAEMNKMVRVKQALINLETPSDSTQETPGYSTDTEVLLAEATTQLPSRTDEPLPKRG